MNTTQTATTKTFRTILQNLVCDRYADRDAALRAIDVAFESRKLTTAQARDLERRV